MEEELEEMAQMIAEEAERLDHLEKAAEQLAHAFTSAVLHLEARVAYLERLMHAPPGGGEAVGEALLHLSNALVELGLSRALGGNGPVEGAPAPEEG